MTTSTLLEAENQIIEAFLYYSDWEGRADAPYAVNIRKKYEGNPIHAILGDNAEFPLLCVMHEGTSAVMRGQQQHYTMSVTVYYLLDIEDYSYPVKDAREAIGKIINNIIGSEDLGLDWVSGLQFSQKQTTSELERLLIQAAPQYTSSSASFVVEFYQPVT